MTAKFRRVENFLKNVYFVLKHACLLVCLCVAWSLWTRWITYLLYTSIVNSQDNHG